MDPGVNLLAGWLGVLAGVLGGAVLGLRFHDESWLGGYGSWQRRMLRLAHISFFGLGFVNIAFALTSRALALNDALAVPSALFLAGAVLMPATCVAAAFVRAARHAFALPVGCVLLAVVWFLAVWVTA